MNKNRVIVSHTSDLDGRIGRELYVLYAGLPADTPNVWVEYGELIEKAHRTIGEWATDRDVTILDFAVSQKFLDDVAEVAISIKLFDHHTGTQKLVAPANCTIICDTNESTVSLLQKHYVGHETPFTNICRTIDLHMIEEPKILAHKLYFDYYFMPSDEWKTTPKDLQYFLGELFDDCSLSLMYELRAKEQLRLAEELANEAVIDRVDRTAHILRDERHKGIDTDILAHYMLKIQDIDFALISWDKDNATRITSVRKLKENPRSLEEYVESRGGGGRETAGAFRTESCAWTIHEDEDMHHSSEQRIVVEIDVEPLDRKTLHEELRTSVTEDKETEKGLLNLFAERFDALRGDV